jgi:hypothetical protein
VSNTNNVRLGVCRVFFGGQDLGYTQGGVDVEVKTDTHQVMVDQFGKSVVNEVIMGRTVTVKVPLAETTLDNLVKIMPGASIVETGATKASGTATFSTVATVGDSISIDGVVFTAATAPAAANQFGIGADATTQAALLAAAINAIDDASVMVVATSALGVVTLTAAAYDTSFYSYNSITLVKSGTSLTVSGATLAGGVLATKQKVIVPTGIGTSLLAIAKMLTLHPQVNADTDRAEDFNIPLAATAGGLKFAYQIDKERIYDVSFSGYPDPNTGDLFVVGDMTAA